MTRKRLPTDARSGAILVTVLVSLFVATLLGLGLVELILIHHRHRAATAQRQQCFWLAESGVQRAIHRLSNTPEYPGEQWVVPGDVLGIPQAAVVTIQVTTVADPSAACLIRVEAVVADNSARRIVYQREHAFKLPSPGASS